MSISLHVGRQGRRASEAGCLLHLVKPLLLSIAMVVAASGCSRRSGDTPAVAKALPPRLDSYFEQFCDETGNMGIGFAPWDTYDYRFRQRLKKTKDTELKRLYVLKNLHREVEYRLRDFRVGRMQIGQGVYRPLTLAEWLSAQQSIQAKLNDLAVYSTFTNFAVASQDVYDRPDASEDTRWIEELRETLRSVTNAPGANPQGGANGRQPSGSDTNQPSAAAASRPSP
jgi:hypothetical protein